MELHSESKIERMEDRLGNIEDLLKRLVDDSLRTDGKLTRTERNRRELEDEASDGDQLDESSGVNFPFTGFTGASADSMEAKNVVEQTVGGSSIAWQDPQLNAALASLQDIVGRLKPDASGPRLPAVSLSAEPEAPPIDEVVALLNRAESMSLHHNDSRSTC